MASATPVESTRAAAAAAAADYESVDRAISAAARDGGAPLGLSRLNLVGQVLVTTVHRLCNNTVLMGMH
jgi:hypothetical protein